MEKPTLEEAKRLFDINNHINPTFPGMKFTAHDPFDTSKFHIANNAVCYKDHTYWRFSPKEIESVRGVSADVAWLATHSAGMQLQFITDSRLIKVRCRQMDSFSMKNMAFTGMCGFDCYEYSDKYHKWMFNRSGFAANYIDDKTWIAYVGEFVTKEERKIILNFPLYNGIMDMEILLEDGAIIRPWEYENKKKILCYGTSILQGCSSSHPGIATTNKVSRYFEQEVYNYGFSGAAMLEKEVANVLATRKDIEMVIIDPEANAGINTKLFENLENFVEIIHRAYPNAPIVMMNRIRSRYDGNFPNTYEEHEFNDRVFQMVLERFKNEGANIRFVDNFHIFSEDESEFTIEGLHPTDTGMERLTDQYIKVIEEVKKEMK